MNLLQKAQPKGIDENKRSILDKIYRSCDPCQRLAPKHFVFQVSTPDEIMFNHEVVADLMWLESKPSLQIVDRGTHFSAAAFVENESSETI